MARARPPAKKATPARAAPKAKAEPARKAGAKRASAPAKRAAAPRRRRFGVRGQRLWDAHREDVEGERGLVLLEEACRIADRLDALDGLLRGGAEVWCRIVEDFRSGAIELRIDGALVEARQQANVLRQIVAALPLKEAAGAGDEDEGWIDNL